MHGSDQEKYRCMAVYSLEQLKCTATAEAVGTAAVLQEYNPEEATKRRT